MNDPVLYPRLIGLFAGNGITETGHGSGRKYQFTVVKI
jgi:hypothetical protein